jgi:thioredoxin-related protein
MGKITISTYYKAFLLLLLFIGSIELNVLAQKGKTNSTINWLSIEEVEAAMKKKPKRIMIDVYTDWCGWCKVMDKKTFTNPDVIKFINENFYAIKLNAEDKNVIKFLGSEYKFKPEHKANELAIKLLNGQMSYPSLVFMDASYQDIIPVPGYQSVPNLEYVTTYLTSGSYKTMPFPDYQKSYQLKWKEQ